jgi:ribosomal protein L37AE/L43A
VLRIECTKCARKGRYSVRSYRKIRPQGQHMKWKEQLNGDCPKCDAHSVHERCDLICPDLPKVL